MINPTDWANLWPMFATNGATGPSQAFDDVEIHESTALETSDGKMLLDCLNWFRVQDPEALKQKKAALHHRAKLEVGANLTHAVFNAAYKAALGRSRGRPRK
jgi:predicted neutral ceramidase superfamily lipid hydrolase